MTIELASGVGPARIDVAYERLGDPSAPPVLLIMGLGAQLIGWPDGLCAELVQRGLHVIRFDNRDAGQSTHLTGAPNFAAALAGDFTTAAYTLSDMAADTVGLLAALGLASAHVVGASLGGFAAQTLAIEQPHRVRSLTSIMSSTGAPGVGQPHAEALRQHHRTRAVHRPRVAPVPVVLDARLVAECAHRRGDRAAGRLRTGRDHEVDDHRQRHVRATFGDPPQRITVGVSRVRRHRSRLLYTSPMPCPRCSSRDVSTKSSVGWCADCETAYDTWVRRHATDIIWAVMGGGVIIAALGLGLPLLGLGSLVGATAAFAGSATIYGLYRGTQRRRRRQFLRGVALPRAYLPSPK